MSNVETKSESEKIWAELDAEEAGKPAHAAVEETPEVKLESGETKEPAKSEESAAAAADQPLSAQQPAAADQGLIDKINGLEAQLQQLIPLASRVRNVEGRIGGINGQLQTLTQARETTAAAGHEAPTATQIREAQHSPEAMAKLKKDYPEFATAMEAALDERVGDLRKQFEDLKAKSVQQGVTPAEIEALRADLTVEMFHRGWKNTVKTSEFAGWMQRQPREVQLLAESDSPQDAVRMLDLYSESRKAAPTNTNRRLETAAAIPTGRGGTPARAKPVEEMSPQELWRYYDEQDRAAAAQR